MVIFVDDADACAMTHFNNVHAFVISSRCGDFICVVNKHINCLNNKHKYNKKREREREYKQE